MGFLTQHDTEGLERVLEWEIHNYNKRVYHTLASKAGWLVWGVNSANVAGQRRGPPEPRCPGTRAGQGHVAQKEQSR